MEGEAMNQAKWQPLEIENDLQPTAGKATGTSASPPHTTESANNISVGRNVLSSIQRGTQPCKNLDFSSVKPSLDP